MQIGSYVLSSPVILAPMAGVTDRPFRQLCRQLGAGLAVSEMVTSNALLWQAAKTLRRLDHRGESEPISVQIAGADPAQMAVAARYNVDHGAQIIDINMGCPAKKVCQVAAGSALLRDEVLVARILQAVVAAVAVPVTLKIRTGWDTHSRNAQRIAKIAAESGIQALAIHGRTRACAYHGQAEYDTIAAVKAVTKIPVNANGDIRTPEQAAHVLAYTRADAVMIGRAAQGRPWIFRDIVHYLRTQEHLPAPSVAQVGAWLLAQLEQMYDLYGEYAGVRIARKHIAWYTRGLRAANPFRQAINQVEESAAQYDAVAAFFATQTAQSPADDDDLCRSLPT